MLATRRREASSDMWKRTRSFNMPKLFHRWKSLVSNEISLKRRRFPSSRFREGEFINRHKRKTEWQWGRSLWITTVNNSCRVWMMTSLLCLWVSNLFCVRQKRWNWLTRQIADDSLRNWSVAFFDDVDSGRVTHGFHWRMMQCTCSERNQWIQNQRNLSSSSASLPRKSQEILPGSVKKSSLKSASRPSAITPKKTVDIRTSPRFSTLPRSRARNRPHVATIFNSETKPTQPNHRPRRKSEVIPWHQQQNQQCTCRSSCYFCNLNYPLSASTNALGYYYPYSTLSLNNPNYGHQSQFNLSTVPNNQYLPNPSYPPPLNQHHHSMINLNHNYTVPTETIIAKPLVTDCPSPTMSNSSPVPAPPAPPLNPSCARCRFTSSVSATSNGTLHRQPVVVGSNPHLHASLSHQNSAPSYGGAPVPAAGTAYTGELKAQFALVLCSLLPRDYTPAWR